MTQVSIIPVQFDHYDNYSEVYLAFVESGQTAAAFQDKLHTYNEKQAYDLFYSLWQQSKLEKKHKEGARTPFSVGGTNWSYAGSSVFNGLPSKADRPVVRLEKIKERSQFTLTHAVIQLESRV